jgi:hypothetical protein
MIQKKIVHPEIKWPLSLIIDDLNEVYKYTCGKYDGECLSNSLFSKVYLSDHPEVNNNSYLIKICIKLLQKINFLNDNNIFACESLLNNILFSNKARDIYLIKCDDFQVDYFPEDKTQQSILPDFLKTLPGDLITVYHQNYALSVIIYMILARGEKPEFVDKFEEIKYYSSLPEIIKRTLKDILSANASNSGEIMSKYSLKELITIFKNC